MATSKKLSMFPTEIVDTLERNNRYKAIRRYTNNAPEILSRLEQEGILDSRDLASVSKISEMSQEDYGRHIQGLFKAYLSRVGFCPHEEKKRIADNFNTLLERTRGDVEWLHAFVSSGYKFMLDADGRVIPDVEYSRRIADNETVTVIDADKLTQYHEVWEKVVEAVAALNAYERENGLTETKLDKPISYLHSSNGMTHYIETTTTKLIRNFREDEWKSIFFEMFANKFAL